MPTPRPINRRLAPEQVNRLVQSLGLHHVLIHATFQDFERRLTQFEEELQRRQRGWQQDWQSLVDDILLKIQADIAKLEASIRSRARQGLEDLVVLKHKLLWLSQTLCRLEKATNDIFPCQQEQLERTWHHNMTLLVRHNQADRETFQADLSTLQHSLDRRTRHMASLLDQQSQGFMVDSGDLAVKVSEDIQSLNDQTFKLLDAMMLNLVGCKLSCYDAGNMLSHWSLQVVTPPTNHPAVQPLEPKHHYEPDDLNHAGHSIDCRTVTRQSAQLALPPAELGNY